jgi:hypothetical protein
MSRFLIAAGLLASAAYVVEGRSMSVADYLSFLETTAARAAKLSKGRTSVTFSFTGTGFMEVEVFLTDEPKNGCWACMRTGLAHEDEWYALYGSWQTQATGDPLIRSVIDRLKDLSEK